MTLHPVEQLLMQCPVCHPPVLESCVSKQSVCQIIILLSLTR